MDQSGQYGDLKSQQLPVLADDEIGVLQSRYQFLFIKGFLGDLLPGRLDHYFSDQLAFLERNNIDHLRLESDSGFGTQKLSKNNVGPIIDALTKFNAEQPGKQVVIISHSKGGLDTLEMLLSEGAHHSVAGWISIQAPFAGTPLADRATDHRISRLIVGGLVDNLFKGDKEVTNDMRTDLRQQYLADHSGAIEALSQSITILNFASHITADDASLFSPQRRLIEHDTKQLNDGVLPQASGVLTVRGEPCCPFIFAEHVDHLAPVLQLKPEPEHSSNRKESERERVFTVLLKLWLNNRATPV